MNTKKPLKETFIDSHFAKNAFYDTVQVTDAAIEAKEAAIRDKREDLDLLQANLDTLNTNIDEKSRQLSALRSDDTVLSDQLDTLYLDIDNLTTEIRKFSEAAFLKEPTSIDIFTLTQVESRKNTIHSEIEALKTKINNALIYYDEEHISSIQQIGDIQTGLIKDLNDVKVVYDRVYKVLKKNTSFMEVCSGDSLDGYPQYVKDYINSFDAQAICSDIDVTNLETNFNGKTELNYTLGSNICSAKKGTCIYERNGENGDPKSYYTDTFDYKFYRHKWPQEDSCEAQSNACFSFGTLSDSACDGDIKTLYFTKTNAPAVYYSSNVGYRSRELPEDPGNWECIVDHSSPWIDSEDTITNNAQNNCELGNRGYGVASYDCYSVTSDEINPTKAKIANSKSKTWNSVLNSDGSIGECDINTTCRTNQDSTKHVECLEQKFKPDGNFQCHTLSADGTNADPGEYRNTYELGTWNSETNKLGLGTCVTKVGECRTQFDVQAEIDCLSTDNWSCAAFNEEPSATNIGSVNVVINSEGKTKKIYTKLDYADLDSTNKGVGDCIEDRACLSPDDLEQQADCHNIDNYRCWTINGTTHNTNQTPNQVFKNYNETNNVCEENTSCMTMENALSTAEEACHASVTRRCYKIDDTDPTNSVNSKSIIYDTGGDTNQYPDGRATMFTVTPTKGECSTRGDCDSDLNLLCGKQIVNCYNSASSELNAPTTTERSMVYNGDSDNMKCVPPEGCTLIPHCSYTTVRTGNSNMFNTADIDSVDCSEGNPYGKKYAWNLETSTEASIANPGSYVNDFAHWSAIIDGSAENTLCVRDALKMNDPLPLTGISEETGEFTCLACDFESVGPDYGWNSSDQPGTTNAQGTFDVFTSTSGEEVVEIVNVGAGLTDNGNGTISYDTRAVNQDACPDPRDASVKDISVYAQKKVVEHRRTVGPVSNAVGCHAKNKIEVKYTLEDTGYRCPFDCVYYWGSNVNDPSEFYEGCYECQPTFGGDGGGFDTWINQKCTPTDCKTPNSHRYPKRLSRGGNREGCSGNGLNPGDEDSSGNADVDKRNWYNNWLALKQNCDLAECPVHCVLGTPSGWGECSESCGPGTQTRTWNIQTQPMYDGNDCRTVFDSQSTAKESGEGFGSITGNTLTSQKDCNIKDCCTPATGTWTGWTDSSGTGYGTGATPNCPTDLCGGNGNTIELTRTSVNRVTCNADGSQNTDQETQRHICDANATPNAGGVSVWSSCPLCVDADETATQTGTRTGKTECSSNGRIVSVADSSETRNCDPQPPTCGPITYTRRDKLGGTCTPNAGETCNWTASPPSIAGTRPAEAQHNTISGKEWMDDGTSDCDVPCAMPQAPTNLIASNITHDSFELSWTPNTNGDATLSSYTIMYQSFVSNEGGTITESWQNIANVPSSSTSYTIIGLESNTSYNVRVKKVFTSGPASNTVISNDISVDTLVFTNKVNLFFDLSTWSDNFNDTYQFRFKDGEAPYTVNNSYNGTNQIAIEEGGYAFNLMRQSIGGYVGLLLYDFDLANLDFVEVGIEDLLGNEIRRTFRISSREIADFIRDKNPSTRGREFDRRIYLVNQVNVGSQLFHKIRPIYRNGTGTEYLLRYQN